MSGPRGEPRETLRWALQELSCGVFPALNGNLRASAMYLTEPQHVRDQPRYINQVITGRTELGPRRLLEAIHGVEKRGGRDRFSEYRFGPRSLDIDLLLYGELVIDSPVLQVPHPRMHLRTFVLEPLVAILPDARDPRSGKRWSEYLDPTVPLSPG